MGGVGEVRKMGGVRGEAVVEGRGEVREIGNIERGEGPKEFEEAEKELELHGRADDGATLRETVVEDIIDSRAVAFTEYQRSFGLLWRQGAAADELLSSVVAEISNQSQETLTKHADLLRVGAGFDDESSVRAAVERLTAHLGDSTTIAPSSSRTPRACCKQPPSER